MATRRPDQISKEARSTSPAIMKINTGSASVAANSEGTMLSIKTPISWAFTHWSLTSGEAGRCWWVAGWVSTSMNNHEQTVDHCHTGRPEKCSARLLLEYLASTRRG